MKEPHRVATRLDPDEKGTHLVSTPSGKQNMTIISESGLYSVILRSDKPEANPYRLEADEKGVSQIYTPG